MKMRNYFFSKQKNFYLLKIETWISLPLTRNRIIGNTISLPTFLAPLVRGAVTAGD